MIKYIPEYIYEKFEEGILEGSFTGYALFFDIKDFTRITESLTRKGKRGAEVINQILEEAFTPVIEAIEQQGGFVTGFAGDAFMAVLDGVEGQNILTVYQVIKNSLATAPEIKEVAEGFKIDARLTVTYGEICWRILNNEYQNEYYFSGSAIEECNSFADYKLDVIFSSKAAEAIGISQFEKLKENTYLPRAGEFAIKASAPKKYHYSRVTQDSFLNKTLRSFRALNEIRDVSNAFIYLDKIESGRLGTVIREIEKLAEMYHGFFNKLDYSDKGLLGILIFGAPRSYEKTLERMLNFVMELCRLSPEIKVGISSGRVYAGYTGTTDCQEYTILGYPPNLASRLMMKASESETLVDIFSYEQLLHRYNFKALGKIAMKGFEEELPVYKLLSEKYQLEETGRSQFTGRQTELQQVINILQRERDTAKPQAVYIHGEPGLGKSRLVREAFSEIKDQGNIFITLICDGILKQPYSPVIKFLKDYFDFEQTRELKENQEIFTEKWQELAGGDAELLRIKSIIGQLLRYRWRESVWELLPPEARPLQERLALVTFFLHLGKEQGLLIHLEDGQWIDDETQEFIKALLKAGDSRLRIVICCRPQSDGRIINYEFANAETLEIRLQELSGEESDQLVSSILDMKQLPGRTRKLILGKGQGNPLYLEQITMYLQEQDFLDEAGNLTKDVEMITAFGISDIIGARIDNLTEEIRELVYYASVLGVEFDIQILSAMLDHDLDGNPEEVVNNCIWRRLKELHYIFAQILIRDTAYNRLLQEKKKQLNLLAAESYGKIYKKEELKPYYEIMGLHYERADCKKEAYASYAAAFFVAYRDIRLKKSLELAKKSLSIKQEVLAEDDILIAQSYNCLGLVYYAMGEYHKALEYTLKALPIFEEKDAKYNLIIALLNNAGNAFSQLGEYERALEYHGKSLLIRSIELGEDHPDYAQSVMHMGNVYLHTGKNEEALEHYEKALKILVNYEKESPGKLVSCYNNLGAFYLQNSDYATALQYLERALPILEENDSLDKPRAASIYRQIGNAYDGLDKISEALSNLNKALEIEEKIFGTEHPQTATTYDYIGRAYLKTVEKDKALEYLQKALDIYNKYYGETHPATGHAYYSIGTCYHLNGEEDAAQESLKKSKAILEKLPSARELLEKVHEMLKEILAGRDG